MLITSQRCVTDLHRHTHLTALSPVLPGWAGTRKVKPIWILLKQESVSGSGISWAICKSAPRSRQTTMPAPHQSVFTGRMPFLPPNQQRQSTEGTVLQIYSDINQKFKWRNQIECYGWKKLHFWQLLAIVCVYCLCKLLAYDSAILIATLYGRIWIDCSTHYPEPKHAWSEYLVQPYYLPLCLCWFTVYHEMPLCLLLCLIYVAEHFLP